jgi:hypothetical protein
MKRTGPSQTSPWPQPARDPFAHLSREERAALKELAEIERAIAALEGRSDASPEDMAHARKEAERLRQALGSTFEKSRENIRRIRRVRLIRAATALALLAALAGIAVVTVPAARVWMTGRAQASEAAKRAAAPFLREGFSEIEASMGPGPRVVTGERGRCFVAVAGSAGGAARVRFERDPLSAEGASVGFCACGQEPARITAVGAEPIELRLLGAPASAVGGADLLGVLPAPPEARVAEGVDRACAEEAIDAFIAAHPPAEEGDSAPAGEAERLRLLGLRRVASSAPGLPLVVLPAVTEACLLALSDAAGDALSLRLRGGERPIQGERKAIAICGRAIEGASVWREGAGKITVYMALADRVGGLLGMRETSERAGRPAALWIAGEDMSFDATAALLASGLAPSGPGDKAGVSFVAVSTGAQSMLSVSEATPGVLCRPAVEIGVARALCLATRADALGGPGGLPPGTAAAKRPLWLPVSAGDRVQHERVLDVLALGRRLSAAGFELTTLMGFVEIPGGVEISGRSGEDEVVAIAVSASPPYIHTLTDGAPWKLDGDPRAVPLPAGKTVKLKAVPPFLGQRGGRETIVWRR